MHSSFNIHVGLKKDNLTETEDGIVSWNTKGVMPNWCAFFNNVMFGLKYIVLIRKLICLNIGKIYFKIKNNITIKRK